METAKRLYSYFYLIVFALYVYIGKGIAYGYFSEILLLLGLFFILVDRKNYEVLWDKRVGVLTVFLFLNIGFIFRGVQLYAVADVLRDSLIFNYALFVFIIFIFRKDWVFFKEKIIFIYKFYPFVQCVIFLLSFIPSVADIEFFGQVHLFHFKYGDICVHLFIASLLLLTGRTSFSKPYNLIYLVVIAYLYLIASSYNRAGMLGFVVSMTLFFLFTSDKVIKKKMLDYLKYLPLILLCALPFFIVTNMEENFQGRKAGIEQLKDNASSIFNADAEGSLGDNKLWRIIWWTKIVQYTFGGEHFLTGKGLGMALASADEIIMDDVEDKLRSPHNFNMTILARYGVPVFLLWLYWLYISLNGLWNRKLNNDKFLYCIIFCMFIFNASFDVFLEGSMGALPFWTFVGLNYAEDAFEQGVNDKTIMDVAV